MTDETTIWTKGDPTAELIRLLERAAEEEVRVTLVRERSDGRVIYEGVPADAGGDWVCVDWRFAYAAMPPVSTLTSVTSPLPPEPVRPSWLPADAEEGGWLLCDAGVAQYEAGRLHWPSGNVVTSPGFYVWSIWPLWAQVKAERERLTAEVERLSMVTEEMVKAAWRGNRSTMRTVLTAALAKRDEGQEDES